MKLFTLPGGRLVLPCVLSLALFTSLGNITLSAADSDKKSSAGKVRHDEATLRKFLLSTKRTAGWNPVKGTISYDFFPDGRLHIQGPDGEATMWQGKWSLLGNQLAIINTDTKKRKTVTVVAAGNDLLLNGELYRRNRY